MSVRPSRLWARIYEGALRCAELEGLLLSTLLGLRLKPGEYTLSGSMGMLVDSTASGPSHSGVDCNIGDGVCAWLKLIESQHTYKHNTNLDIGEHRHIGEMNARKSAVCRIWIIHEHTPP